jgi:hypothetical protein
VDSVFGSLPLLRWEEIMKHNTEEDLWIVVQGRVWEMTEFIAADHPGGSEIPAEYGGKDATDFWIEIHGHLEAEILEDLVEGEGYNTGLEGASLPRLIGLCADDPPPEAMGTAGYERYISRNWAGIVEWQVRVDSVYLSFCSFYLTFTSLYVAFWTQHKGEDGSFLEPESVQEVQALVRAHSKVRVLGKGHCFPALCDGGGEEGEVVLSLLGKMCKILSLDGAAKTVTVQGGTTYSQLTRYLIDETDLALPTAASLAHTTIAGSMATGSHGSSGIDGDSGRAHLASNSAYITAVELVVADGSLLRLTRDDPPFAGVVVSTQVICCCGDCGDL